MVTVGETGGPTPMDWIFDARSYGMKIRYNTPGANRIDWSGSRVLYQKMRFTMEALGDMMHGLMEEMRQELAALLIIEGRDRSQFPAIRWEELEDDHSEDRVGYSFLTDERNEWAAEGGKFVLGQILSSPQAKARWIQAGEQPYRAQAVRQYKRQMEGFREKLLAMVHVTGGQPGRTGEILGLRFRNTGQGGVRNIFVQRGMVCFVVWYHKNMRSVDQAKVVHRFLPREVGELLVWYLWLILPFWQQIQGVIKGVDASSAFLWTDEIVSRGAGKARKARKARVRVGKKSCFMRSGEHQIK